jgi:small subunit ribosomal protein S8
MATTACLRVYLKYYDGTPVIRHLERVSRPGRRRYVGSTEIPRVRNGLGMAILSTSQGRAVRPERPEERGRGRAHGPDLVTA